MEEKLLTPGEFAKLARTTRRTVLWYAKKGILLPHKVDDSGYRFYLPKQIIDFQMVLLLRDLDTPLDEIRSYLNKSQSPDELFAKRREIIKHKLHELKKQLRETEEYQQNITKFGLLIKPVITQIPSQEIYYLSKTGPYSKIKSYVDELLGMLKVVPKDVITLAGFEETGYNPKKAKMIIGVVISPAIKLNPDAQNIVKKMKVPEFKALTYTHHGSPAILSLFWQELGEYRAQVELELDTSLPFADVEFYRSDKMASYDDQDNLVTEICLPILP
jgi:DNA-binding transcriptional MerR regulator